MTAQRARRLESMTAPEVGAAIADGVRTAVLPCGAIEQHGPHLPLSVDSDHADRLGLMLAERLGDALVAPTLRLGCSGHHLAFAGTLSLRPETFEALCMDCCTSLAEHGFERVVIFSAHIGNYPMLADMAPRLSAAVPAGVAVDVFCNKEAILRAWREATADAGGPAKHVGGHADIAETSIMLALRPESVRRSLAEAGFAGDPDEEVLARLFAEGVAALAPNGVLGDPTGMSPAIGHACLEAVTSVLADFAASRRR
jgi:creatinine amidohydrolase